MDPPTPNTLLINRALAGDAKSRESVFTALHSELRQMAARLMRGERADHSWRPSDLLQECYVRLLPNLREVPSRSYFFAAAQRAMRQLLIDHAIHNASKKRGGGRLRRSMLDEQMATIESDVETWAQFEEALTDLRNANPDQSTVFTLSVFYGLDFAQIAALLDFPEKRVRAALKVARGFMYSRLRRQNG